MFKLCLSLLTLGIFVIKFSEIKYDKINTMTIAFKHRIALCLVLLRMGIVVAQFDKLLKSFV